MNTERTLIKSAAFLLLLLTLNSQLSTLLAQGAAFTYQGRLTDNAGPANGANYDMVFALYDAPTNGNLFNKLEINSVPVSNGLFTVTLDYDASFSGGDRWLEISVQKNGGGFSMLSPRQQLTPTPYAITASNLSGTLPAGQLTGTVPTDSIAGSYTSAVSLNNPANVFSGSFTGDGSGLTNLPGEGNAWQVTGNAGTTAGISFLGTTDNQPLELRVNGVRALRLEPNTSGAPNVIGGASINFVTPGTLGAVIAGGGALNGFGDVISNSVAADFSSIGGGGVNTISTKADFSTIGGGGNNMVQTYASGSTISGGTFNTIQGSQPRNLPPFIGFSTNSTIGGGAQNTIQIGAEGSTISGGQSNTIEVGAETSSIGGGINNTIQSNADWSTISGGSANTIQTSAEWSAIGGGNFNTILSGAFSSTISGGRNNKILSFIGDINAGGCTIGGGANNLIQGGNDSGFDTIGGGRFNTLLNSTTYATVGGGEFNTNGGYSSTIGGGMFNMVQFSASFATISGGGQNAIQTNSSYCTIAGGARNTIQTNAFYSTIGGGISNAAAGNYATVPGGDQNVAGTNSLAAGHRAKATNTGAFVWADSTDADFASTADNQFLIRASGGVGIGANNPDAALTVNGTADKPGGGAWTVFSDARLKKNIEPLTGALNRLLELRAVTFEYKDPQSIHELPGVQIGMIAQEVEKVFPDWVDTAPNGMKRLSIHGFEALTVEALRELRAEKDAKISELEKSNTEMQQRLAVLEKTVARLTDQSSIPLATTDQPAK